MDSISRIQVKDGKLCVSVTKAFNFPFHRLKYHGFERIGEWMVHHSPQLYEQLAEVVDMFNVLGIPYTLSQDLSRLMRKGISEKELLEKARDEGMKIKNSQRTIPLSIQGLIRELFPYQEKAVLHMVATINPANLSAQGAGKTTMINAFFQFLVNNNIVDKMLVIGPKTSFKVWEKELTDCLGPDKSSVRLEGPHRKNFFGVRDYDLYLTNFHLLYRDLENIKFHLQSTGRYLVVVDEAHYVKKSEAGKIAEALHELAPFAVRRLISTGTPCPNGLIDLYSLFGFLWPSKGITGSLLRYKHTLKNKSPEYIRQLFDPFFYRVTKSDLNLPGVEYHEIKVKMGPFQQRIYNAVEQQALEDLHSLSTNDQMLYRWQRAWVIRLNQIASNPALLINNAVDDEEELNINYSEHVVELCQRYKEIEVPSKITACLDVVENVFSLLRDQNKGQKVVVWTNFKKNIMELEEKFKYKGYEVYSVYGDVTNDEREVDNRDARIEGFKTTKEPAIFLATPASCAESISLNKVCEHMIYVDLTFNACHWCQSKDRIHRIGTDRTVHYYILMAKNSYDERIYQRLLGKEEQMLQLLGDIPFQTEPVSEEISFKGLFDFDQVILNDLNNTLSLFEEII